MRTKDVSKFPVDNTEHCTIMNTIMKSGMSSVTLHTMVE